MKFDNLPPYVTIGEHTYGAEMTFHRWGQERITIGKWCSISQQVKFLAGGLHRTDCVTTYPLDVLLNGKQTAGIGDRCYDHGTGIEIGNDVYIGFGASIIGNVKIGHGAVIAANATVFTDVPPYAIVGGNPAKVLRMRFEPEVIERLLRIKWWDWLEENIKRHVDDFYLPILDFVKRFDPLMYRNCPVCGFDQMLESYDICHCCGFEACGQEDWDNWPTLRAYWVEGGMKWWSQHSVAPQGWNPVEQLAKIGAGVHAHA